MITMGFNTLAMLTFGLGNRMPLIFPRVIRRRQVVEFRDKPMGVAVEEKTAPTDFVDLLTEFKDKSVEFEDE